MILVVDGGDNACNGVALLVAELAEEVAIKPPFKGERILGEDEVFVIVVIADPLAVDLYLSTRDVEDKTVIIALTQSNVLAPADSDRQTLWHQVFQEEARRIHQNQGLRLIPVESDIVSEVCRRPDHIQ